MTVWLVRAGSAGEYESWAMAHDVAIVGWQELPDLAPLKSRGEVHALLRQTYADAKPRTLTVWLNQLWPLRETMQQGDLVALPLKTRPVVIFGRVTGPYARRFDLAPHPLHTRPVEWFAQIPRRAFDPDLLFSFGSFLSVCRVERNSAEERLNALLQSQTWPSPTPRGTAPMSNPVSNLPLSNLRIASSSPVPLSFNDLEARSRTMIRERIAQRFKGHALAHLVGALLEVQGYRARVSPPGPDGGVDILAGSGLLGFDNPRLVVQVKSQDTKVDVRVLREMTGVMQRFQADHGLLVAWGGFKQAVRSEAATDYFRIRLWEGDDLVRAVQEHYGLLPPHIRNDIPMKQVWTLVPGPGAMGYAPMEPAPAVPAAEPPATDAYGPAGFAPAILAG